MTTGPGTPSPQQPKRKQVKIEIPADLAAEYVNFALITHSMSEIIMDFAQVLPNTPKARIKTRVIITPTNAKLLHKALGDSIEKYEARHGEIKVPPTLADQLFRSVRTVDDDNADGPGEDGSNE
jgi:hypothetical protein